MPRSSSINPGFTYTRCFAALALLAGFVLLAIALPATADAATITVVNQRSGDAKDIAFPTDAMAQDVDADYVIRDASGPRTQRINGVSLKSLLSAPDIDPVYSAIDISRPGGDSVRVSKFSILGDGLVPVVYESGGSLVFVRPSTSETDLNGPDVINAGSTLTLTQVDLGSLKVTAKASKKTVKVGQLVKFTGAASGGGAGDTYEYAWNFKDGTTAKGASVSHRFKKRGTYTVLLTAGIKNSGRSDPALVEIQVGAKVKSKRNRSGGGNNDAAGAPTSGAADGASGSGQNAANADDSKSSRDRKKSNDQPTAVDQPDLPVVSGELLGAITATPVVPDSGLAARTGQVLPPDNGLALSNEALVGLAAALLLMFGAARELDLFGRARRRLRGVS